MPGRRRPLASAPSIIASAMRSVYDHGQITQPASRTIIGHGSEGQGRPMKVVIALLTVVYAAIALVFGVGALCLLGLAAMQLWQAVAAGGGAPIASRAALAIESIGLITVSLMSLEMAQTV